MISSILKLNLKWNSQTHTKFPKVSINFGNMESVSDDLFNFEVEYEMKFSDSHWNFQKVPSTLTTWSQFQMISSILKLNMKWNSQTHTKFAASSVYDGEKWITMFADQLFFWDLIYSSSEPFSHQTFNRSIILKSDQRAFLNAKDSFGYGFSGELDFTNQKVLLYLDLKDSDE